MKELEQNKITIFRGSHQIGGCSTEISTGRHRILIDFGANLPDYDNEGSMSDDELYNEVFENENCDAVLFSHYHGDHIGLYKRIPRNIPLYIGSTAKKILELLTEKLDRLPDNTETGLPIIRSMNTYSPAKKLTFGDIQVTPFVVDHSALDAYMFLIEAGGKRILFTGDFRDHGIAGEYNALEKTVKAYIGKVDILITEGTMLSRVGETDSDPIRTEEELGRRARELFLKNKISVILVSSTNLDSIMEFYHALPCEMGFVCDAYQAKVMLTAMSDKGRYYDRYNPELTDGKPRRLYIVGNMEGLGEEQNCYEANFSVLIKKGFTLLVRENNPMFRNILAKLPDPLMIYSKWTGYLEGKHASPAIQELIKGHRMEKLHTSGHAYVETIAKLIKLTNPKTIIPMHTECADDFAKLPEFSEFNDRVRVLSDMEPYYF